MSGELNVSAPEQIEGHRVVKFFNKISGQPDSYVNKADFVFGRTLGAGSFGVVRQARKLSSGENLAIKILLKKALKGSDVQLQMLYDELSILQMLNHPNIVNFKDWFESKDKFYIVTQLATGGELFDRILSRGNFTEEDAVKIIVQILDGVEYIHSKNIVHRDLKPENVLYIDKTDDSKLVIADFGIAKKLKNSNDLIIKSAGSLGYVAPEVLTVNGHGKPCDIWSIGVITYTLLSGYSAFIAESVEGFLEECTSGRYPVKFHKPYWDNISDDAKNFILRCLILDPSQRPTATELLTDPWIISKTSRTEDLLPGVKKGFDARNKFREAVEIVKLNNRIQKLRDMYCADESETDIEENSSRSSLESLTQSINDLKLKAESATGLSDNQRQELKSTLTQNAFAQIVRAATSNKDKILSYDEQQSTENSNI